MTFTEKEMTVMETVLREVLFLPEEELHKRFGSLTIIEMCHLHSKIHYRDYCKRHNIDYNDMTEEDFERAYREEWEA